MFDKPLRSLTAADVLRVCEEAVQEDANVEFKRTLAAKNGKDDVWICGGDAIGDHARNDLVKEVVAFANAYGGTLILGMDESGDKPARAAAINALPKCHDLAERLRLVFRDMIEPRLPRVDAVGIETGGQGEGVVVVQVPRSRSAPHRHKGDWQCYFRHADRSEKMPMHEIQDLTLRVRQGVEEIEEKFAMARREFLTAVDHVQGIVAAGPEPEPVCGMCASLVPLEPVNIDHVHRDQGAKPTPLDTKASFGGSEHTLLRMPLFSGAWRPTLRGSVKTDGSIREKSIASIEVNDDGFIQTYLIVEKDSSFEELIIFPSWCEALFVNSLLFAERFRAAARAPAAEYGLEFVLSARGSVARIGAYGHGYPFRFRGTVREGDHAFPRYSIGAREDFGDLASLFDRDFWNLAGEDYDQKLIVDFEDAFSRMPSLNRGLE